MLTPSPFLHRRFSPTLPSEFLSLHPLTYHSLCYFVTLPSTPSLIAFFHLPSARHSFLPHFSSLQSFAPSVLLLPFSLSPPVPLLLRPSIPRSLSSPPFTSITFFLRRISISHSVCRSLCLSTSICVLTARHSKPVVSHRRCMNQS